MGFLLSLWIPGQPVAQPRPRARPLTQCGFRAGPGEPICGTTKFQLRGDTSVCRNGHAVSNLNDIRVSVNVYDPPPTSRGQRSRPVTSAQPWRKVAQFHMARAMARAGYKPREGPLRVSASFCFALPMSRHRIRSPVNADWHVSTPDAENLFKPLADAGNGIVWDDDKLIAQVLIEKRFGAQGEEPGVQLQVEELGHFTDGRLARWMRAARLVGGVEP